MQAGAGVVAAAAGRPWHTGPLVLAEVAPAALLRPRDPVHQTNKIAMQQNIRKL